MKRSGVEEGGCLKVSEENNAQHFWCFSSERQPPAEKLEGGRLTGC
jgi:hypothetical protein